MTGCVACEYAAGALLCVGAGAKVRPWYVPPWACAGGAPEGGAVSFAPNIAPPAFASELARDANLLLLLLDAKGCGEATLGRPCAGLAVVAVAL